MKVQGNQLSLHLNKSLAPCYLVSGDEFLLVDEALDSIREKARNNGFLSRELHIATPGFDWSLLKASMGNLSLFTEKRIIELRLPTGKPGKVGSATIIDIVKQIDSDILFIVVSSKLDRTSGSSKWVKAMDQKGVLLPFWPIDINELPRWILHRMKSLGMQPDREAVMLITNRVEGNLLAAHQEIEKLRLILGEGAVSVEAASKAVANNSRYDVFKLIDAALKGDSHRSIKILGRLRKEGVEPVIITWALSREIRILALVDDAIRQGEEIDKAMQKPGIWQSRKNLIRHCVNRHQQGDFNKMLKVTGRADMTAKGQISGDPWLVATDIILSLSQ
ncbi:MAG: DNA polymerase III subunit delta [Gammaproteobacteria bacterium]|nr:DNA polymerase III subunit delta [Gammaproteobacteria bacterium]